MKKLLFLLPIFALAGCTTTTQNGTTTKQIDKEAVAQAVDIAVTILHDPVVSNAVYNAVNKK